MEHEQLFDTGVVCLNYAEFAATPGATPGDPIVVLHGGSARWQAAQPIIPALTEYGPVYALDLRGHGLSGRVPGHYTLRDYMGDVITFLEGVVRGPAVLFGHSMGGQVAILVAAQRPDLVRALISGDAPFDPAKLRPRLAAARARLLFWRDLAGGRLSRDEIAAAMPNTPVEVAGQAEPVPAHTLFPANTLYYRFMAENLYHLDPDQLTAVVEFDAMHAGLDYRVLFPQITCPVLLLQGNPALDGMPDEDVAAGLALLADGRVARMETVGHPLHTVDPVPVMAAIAAFLAALAPQPRRGANA
jgi:pimeloyl-ACP methyl ester carboxylesterase